MLDLPDLSGRWIGYYTQHDRRRPISAEISQEGTELTGRMNDECTTIEASISEIALEEGLPPGADEQIVARIRSVLPDAPLAPIRAEVQLPPESTLHGEVRGRAVQFLKTYRGRHFAGYRIGGLRLGILGEDQEVHYRGVVSPDGREIEGHWRISGLTDDVPLLPRTEGGFVLRREGADPDSN